MMKFVLMLWCDVWVCEIGVKWIVDDKITCSNYAYMYNLQFPLKIDEIWSCCW